MVHSSIVAVLQSWFIEPAASTAAVAEVHGV